jgi:hypothetical protein
MKNLYILFAGMLSAGSLNLLAMEGAQADGLTRLDLAEVLSVTDRFECVYLQRYLLDHINNVLHIQNRSAQEVTREKQAKHKRHLNTIDNITDVNLGIDLLRLFYDRLKQIANITHKGEGHQTIKYCHEIDDIFECIRMHQLTIDQMVHHLFEEMGTDLPSPPHDEQKKCEVEIIRRDQAYECLFLQQTVLVPKLIKLYKKFEQAAREIPFF